MRTLSALCFCVLVLVGLASAEVDVVKDRFDGK